ncbi:MAG: phosphoribosylformylglycinamidine synthase subunit PurS [Candidatus Altiarchaeota archaeon]|nr:phosphoribosylformylglycinamidine synthase subunit PurS [Candidatus Altiarchaeota archaeon]
MKFTVNIEVKLKEGLLNPEANTIQRSLNLIGYKNVSDFDTEKMFSMKLEAKSKDEAAKQADEMCRRILVNPVIQDYKISVV